tara:strand:- start:934 stop:3033 length:2100 start_codon:yes stop_codon:yes gene_type:complete
VPQNRYDNLIPQKNKKKFKSSIEVTFLNNVKCKFNSLIRQSGDKRDHIIFSKGNILQSIDIKLIDGNIDGITRFKLLIPNTRNNPEEELLFTKILQSLNFLAPRTFFVNVNLNNTNTKMLFQEKINKEMLEFNKRIEGPILEGDERYMWSYINQNNKDRNAGIKNQIAKQTNSSWSLKSKNHQIIANKALTDLNIVYLNFINQIKKLKSGEDKSHYNLNNVLLTNNNEANKSNLESFELLMYAMNAFHGLAPHNRKFYWNSIKKYFEPIYYDGHISVFSLVNVHLQKKIHLKNIKIIKSKLMALDKNQLFDDIHRSGSSLSRERFKKILKQINLNINQIANNKINPSKSEIKNNISILTEYIKNLSTTVTDTDNIKLVFKKKDNNFLICKIDRFDCIIEILNDKEMRSLLEGKLRKNNSTYQYIGNAHKFRDFLENEEIAQVQVDKKKLLKIENTDLFYGKNISVEYLKEKKILNIYQKDPEARAYFKGGTLSNLEINFYGINNEKNAIKKLSKFPFDNDKLTGCLSFFNLNLNNININAEKGICEDTLNFINSTGTINSIKINESFADALDVDFSNLKINNINIKNAGNDCADFSWGNYIIEKAKTKKCTDKAFSIGEKSTAIIRDLSIEDTEIGVSSKDGSVTNLDKVIIKNTTICLEVKRKKQEFYGGVINIKKQNCKKNQIYMEEGSFINNKNVL